MRRKRILNKTVKSVILIIICLNLLSVAVEPTMEIILGMIIEDAIIITPIVLLYYIIHKFFSESKNPIIKNIKNINGTEVIYLYFSYLGLKYFYFLATSPKEINLMTTTGIINSFIAIPLFGLFIIIYCIHLGIQKLRKKIIIDNLFKNIYNASTNKKWVSILALITLIFTITYLGHITMIVATFNETETTEGDLIEKEDKARIRASGLRQHRVLPYREIVLETDGGLKKFVLSGPWKCNLSYPSHMTIKHHKYNHRTPGLSWIVDCY